MEWSQAWPLIRTGALAAFTIVLVLWLVQFRTKNAGIVDFGWAAIMGVLAHQRTISAFFPWSSKKEPA